MYLHAAHLAATARPVDAQLDAGPARSRYRWQNPFGTAVAALVTVGASELPVADLRADIGRPGGYDSLANARRAAFMLTRGDTRPAAGIFRQGDDYFVRSLGTQGASGMGTLNPLHVEGSRSSLLTIAQDPRLSMIVDGSTKLFVAGAVPGHEGRETGS